MATGDDWEYYREEIQILMRDYANSNLLLDAIQFTPKEIERALCRTLDQYNFMPPSFGDVTIATMPKYPLLLGAARWLMLSETFLQARNQVSFQTDDNEAVGVDDKAPLYLQLAQTLEREWNETVKQYKISKNMESAYGSQPSGYRNMTRYNS